MIKAVVFDCFGVFYVDPGLYFYSRNVPNYEEVHDQIMELDRAFDRGVLSMEEHDHAVAGLTGLTYETVRDEVRKPMRRHDDMLEYSQALRKKYKVGMLSNVGQGPMFEQFFSRQDQAEFFDEVVLSYETGYIKPDPRAFEVIAEQLGVLPEECVMVDDREENCEAARAVGMKAVRYEHFAQFRRTLEALL